MSSASAFPPCTPQLAAEDKGPRLLIVTWVLFTLATIAVALRFYARTVSKVGFWLDDWSIVVSLAIGLSYAFTTVPLYLKGFGKHYECADADAIPFFLKTLFSWEYIYTLTIAFAKYSIILFLYRVFRSPSFKKIFWVLMSIITAWTVAIVITACVTCIPLHSFWGEGTGTCIDPQAFYLGISIPNIVTDCLLLATPIPYIVRLNMVKSKKIALVGVFACGALVIVISAIRFVVLFRTSTGADVTWNDVEEVEWSIAECSVAIICACLPSMGPLLKAVVERTTKASNGTPWSAARRYQDYRPQSSGGNSHDVSEHPAKSLDAKHSSAGLVQLRELNVSGENRSVVDRSEENIESMGEVVKTPS